MVTLFEDLGHSLYKSGRWSDMIKSHFRLKLGEGQLYPEVAKLLESAKSGDSGRSSKELKEDASAKIEQIKSESIKERMQRIYKTGTAGKRYSAPAVVPETAAETVEDPAESSTTIVPAGPGSDIGPGHGPAQEPAVGPAAEIGQ